MVTLLAGIFIKDKENTSSPEVRQAYGMLTGIVGIFLNICMFEYSAFSWQMDCRNGEWFYCYYGRCV